MKKRKRESIKALATIQLPKITESLTIKKKTQPEPSKLKRHVISTEKK